MDAVQLPLLSVTFWLALALDALLWILPFVIHAGPEVRFRFLSCASLLFYVVLSLILGMSLATGIWIVGLWLFAIIASRGGAERGATEQPVAHQAH